MAQYDTGLGWSAKDSWLVLNADTVLADLSNVDWDSTVSPNPGNIPITAPSVTDIVNNGVRVWDNTRYSQHWYAGTDVSSCIIFAAVNQYGYPSQYIAVSPFNNAKVYLAMQGAVNYTTIGCNNQVPNESLYYGVLNEGSGYQIGNFAIPTFSSKEDAWTHLVVVSTEFKKTNDGYAVTCIFKWKTSTGTRFESPILISNNSDFVEMSTDETVLNFAKLNVLYDGMIFYMGFYDRPYTGNLNTQYPTIDLTAQDDPYFTLEDIFRYIAKDTNANIIVLDSPDPYETQTGSSEEDGGNGEEIVDDDVDFTPLPSSMAVASGFITLFCPSQYELNQLANYMWSPLFDVDTFKKLFANPMDCILGLAVYPFPISASGTKTVSVGGIATTVSMGYTLQQYHIVDCGSVYVPKQWGAYMDYAPYTRFNIFLPYIGFRSISADDIMGKTIALRYMVDILSGACNAELKCGSTVLYSWAGSCAAQIPITGNDWRSAITAGISIAGSVAATVLTQGASAPMIAGTVASATVNSTQLKPEVQRSGSISGNSGFLAGQRPYLLRTNPRSAIPANQNKYSGYPSFVTILLGSLTGYNEVYSVHLENIPATGAELDEIESILKGGAIF